jgi:LPS export ABC transporter protein LptC
MIRLLLFALFMAAGTGLFYLVFVHEVPHETFQGIREEPVGNTNLVGLVARQQRGATLEWTLRAAEGIYFENGRRALLTTVSFEAFRPGTASSTPERVHGVADRAAMDQARRQVILQGNVRIRREPETEIRGDVMDYRQQEGLLAVQGHAWIRDQDIILEGEQLEYNVTEDRILVSAPAIYQ